MWHCLLASQTMPSNQRVQPSTPIGPLLSLLPAPINKPNSHEIGQPLWREPAIKHACSLPQTAAVTHSVKRHTHNAERHRENTCKCTVYMRMWGGWHWQAARQESSSLTFKDNNWIRTSLYFGVFFYTAVWVKCQFGSVTVLRLASASWITGHICWRALWGFELTVRN